MKKLLLALIVFNSLTLAMQQPPKKRGLKRIAQDIEREEYEMAQSLSRMCENNAAPIREIPSSDDELAQTGSEKQEGVASAKEILPSTKSAIEGLPTDLRKIIILSLAQADDIFRAHELQELLQGTPVSVQDVGGSNLAGLFNAAQSIRRLLLSNKNFVPLLKDVKFARSIIINLSKTYDTNLVLSATALGTDAASRAYAALFDSYNLKGVSTFVLTNAIVNRDLPVVNFIFKYLSPNQALSLVNESGVDNLSPLMQAVGIERNSTIVERLLQVPGINVNMRAAEGNTALMLAIKNKNLPAIIQLINAGANINLANNNGTTPLMLATFYGEEDIVKYLFELPAINTDLINNRGFTALMSAAEKGQYPNIVQQFIKHGVSMDQQERALFLAIINDHPNIVKILLDAGVDVNKPGPQGLHMLRFARISTKPNKEAIIQLLLKHGAQE